MAFQPTLLAHFHSSVSQGAGFVRLTSFPVPFADGEGMSHFLLLPPRLLLAVMLPGHGGFLSLWNHKAKTNSFCKLLW